MPRAAVGGTQRDLRIGHDLDGLPLLGAANTHPHVVFAGQDERAARA